MTQQGSILISLSGTKPAERRLSATAEATPAGGERRIIGSPTRHDDAKTTGLHDRRNDDIIVSEVERIGI